MKILVAMSGGVDSSVVAHLLKRQGHECIGIMMQLWTDPLAPVVEKIVPTKCCSIEHMQRARSVCNKLDMPFYVVNLSDEFKRDIVDPFLEGYKKGETPNPCIECNRNIKFGVLLDKMRELGCEKLATGHYARIEQREDGWHLLRAKDERKDQTYYMYSLTQEKMESVLFPLGDMHKDETYELAQKYGVENLGTYRESQDLCFYPEKDPSEFLKRYLGDIPPGPIKTRDGTTVGEHKGLPFYTTGQRKGLGVGGQKIPLHVTHKEHKSNTVYVAPSGEDCKNDVFLEDIEWNRNDIDKDTLMCRINSLGQLHSCTVHEDVDPIRIESSTPLRGIAAGQYCVFYNGDEVLGGGRIVNE